MSRHRVKVIECAYLAKDKSLIVRYKVGDSTYRPYTKDEIYLRLCNYWFERLLTPQ